ncbi:hypothetical protein EYF80_050529 [Liparis tanakae]|uniref:Uncharacterized protein n=1 Tax=Liparis tanakae TaxID=230148 RepID=A0A4Z2FDM9_9TELE|nr:hypothetical protein EYF80_050529 [Liparis tanakae]
MLDAISPKEASCSSLAGPVGIVHNNARGSSRGLCLSAEERPSGRERPHAEHILWHMYGMLKKPGRRRDRVRWQSGHRRKWEIQETDLWSRLGSQNTSKQLLSNGPLLKQSAN